MADIVSSNKQKDTPMCCGESVQIYKLGDYWVVNCKTCLEWLQQPTIQEALQDWERKCGIFK